MHIVNGTTLCLMYLFRFPYKRIDASRTGPQFSNCLSMYSK